MSITALAAIIPLITTAFTFQESVPSSLFPYQCAVYDNAPFTAVLNPAYLPFYKTAYAGVSYHNPYSIDGLNSSGARAGVGFSSMAVSASWQRFGIKEYGEDIFSGLYGAALTRWLNVGAHIKYQRGFISTDELYETFSLCDGGLSLLWMPCRYVAAGVFQDNMYTLYDRSRRETLFPETGLGLIVQPADGISASYNINRQRFSYVQTFSASAHILRELVLSGGYSPQTSSFACSVTVIYRNFNVSYGLRYHSYLGATHSFGLTLSLDHVYAVPVNYKAAPRRYAHQDKATKINLSTCSYDELKKSGIMREEIAARLIKYRSTVGPLTETALFQAGCNMDELRAVRESCSGIEFSRDKKPKQRIIKSSAAHTAAVRKDIFTALVKGGVTASVAMKIADLAKTKTKSELIAAIGASKEFSVQDKSRAVLICEKLL